MGKKGKPKHKPPPTQHPTLTPKPVPSPPSPSSAASPSSTSPANSPSPRYKAVMDPEGVSGQSLAPLKVAASNEFTSSASPVERAIDPPSSFSKGSLVAEKVSETEVVTISSPTGNRKEILSSPVVENARQSEVADVPAPMGNRMSTPSSPKLLKSWVSMVQQQPQKLKKQGQAFKLPSGEICVKIPNSVIEKHKSEWDCFVIGQFYSDPPSQGVIHNVVNGIWSRGSRDISVSKMDSSVFLFRIPNAATRKRVISQRLWQIAGQTIFVDRWEPGLLPTKPELKSAPLWLELRDVPLQFFNKDGLEYIASLVGEPKELHPATSAKTNLEVAKVLTIIDPREPLPEAVNVQFESGEIRRVRVSSPWMPPVCSFCKELGHTQKRCKQAPATCKDCGSTVHETSECPRMKRGPKNLSQQNGNVTRKDPRTQEKEQPEATVVHSQNEDDRETPTHSKTRLIVEVVPTPPSQVKDQEMIKRKGKEIVMEEDSSDVSSNESNEDDWYENIRDFKKVLSKRQQKQQRGKGLTIA